MFGGLQPVVVVRDTHTDAEYQKLGLEQTFQCAGAPHQRAELPGASGECPFKLYHHTATHTRLTINGYLQITQELFPLLLLLGDAVTCASGLSESVFVTAIPQLHTASGRLHGLMELAVNLLQQLGALCSEQTRKSTVISGTTTAGTQGYTRD